MDSSKSSSQLKHEETHGLPRVVGKHAEAVTDGETDEQPAPRRSTVTLIGARPRPRILFLGAADDDPLLIKARELIETVEAIPSFEAPVRQSEWDVIVSTNLGPACDLPGFVSDRRRIEVLPRLCAFLRFQATNWETIEPGVAAGHGLVLRVDLRSGVVSNEFCLPGAILPASVAALVKERLLPAVQRRADGRHVVVGAGATAYGNLAVAQRTQIIEGFVRPFCTTGDGHALAGWYPRHADSSEAWVIPDDVGDMWPWLCAALNHWHDRWPDRFPIIRDWRVDPRWYTPSERAVHDELEAVAVERDRVLADLDTRETVLTQHLAEAHDTAEHGNKRLLSAKGSDLVAAVIDVLSALGFRVTDSDGDNQGGPRLEDLEIHDPANLDWVAIAEVRGYGGGAQSNDIGRISRHAEHFAAKHHRRPDARWYIVNQFIDKHPDTRPPILQNDQPWLDHFAGDGGMALDTVDLYRLANAVERHDVSPEAAREHLRATTGRFTWQT